jgi:hypothetical protein
VLVIIAGLGVAGFMMARARTPKCASEDDKIISADQVTQQEGDNLHPPPDLVTVAERLASCGVGQLILIRSAGQGGVQAGPAASLRIYREPGEIENDPTARAAKVRQLIAHAFTVAAATRPPGAGRDTVGLIATIAG